MLPRDPAALRPARQTIHRLRHHGAKPRRRPPTQRRHRRRPRPAEVLVHDSRLDIDVPLARHAISSVGALSFKIGDLSNPKPAKHGDTQVDLTSFAALTTQVDAPAMSDMLNNAITNGPVSLPDAVAMLETAYLGHVIVLWS
jgi:hypothetical protein